MRAEREAATAHRKDALTGTSDFPESRRGAGRGARRHAGAARAARRQHQLSARCRRIRLAEPFERLRDASDRMLAKTGARPKIFLANLGTLADFTARATFAKNFFEAGGIEAVTNDGFATAATTMIAGVQGVGREARLPVLVRRVYEREEARRDAAKALAAARRRRISIWPAAPKDAEALLKGSPGVGDASSCAGCDALAARRLDIGARMVADLGP